MNDLNVISRLNAEAHERDIPNQQAKGLYVVAEYTGLHYTGYSVHETQVEANAAACRVGNQIGRRAKVYNPTTVTTVEARLRPNAREQLAAAQAQAQDDTLPSESPVYVAEETGLTD